MLEKKIINSKGTKKIKKALITGITSQDGSYLAEFLLKKGYEVHGIVRRVAIEDPEHRLWRIYHILDQIQLHAASMESFASIYKTFNAVKPDECYHLAAQSFVTYSFEDEFSTLNTNINGTHYVLSAIKECVPECRFYFAASSEMFGNTTMVPQDETTPFNPRSSYGISKVAGYHLTKNYREAYGLKAWNGILYNHESPRRGYEFVTRKITSHVAKIKLGLNSILKLGNLEAKRDWGYAPEYVEAMWLMLQQPEPDDYVISTGITHSVKEFAEKAFQAAEYDIEWQGKGLDIKGIDKKTGKVLLEISPDFYRPSEVDLLVGNSAKARKKLGWQPKTKFEELVRIMVEADINRLLISKK